MEPQPHSSLWVFWEVDSKLNKISCSSSMLCLRQSNLLQASTRPPKNYHRQRADHFKAASQSITPTSTAQSTFNAWINFLTSVTYSRALTPRHSSKYREMVLEKCFMHSQLPAVRGFSGFYVAITSYSLQFSTDKIIETTRRSEVEQRRLIWTGINNSVSHIETVFLGQMGCWLEAKCGLILSCDCQSSSS